MVKRFFRSAAATDIKISDIIRTPATLLCCINFLEDWIISRDELGPDPRFHTQDKQDFLGALLLRLMIK